VQRVTVDGKVKKACKLSIVPEEAQLVSLIFKIFLETNSLTKTETYFIQNGCKTKNGKMFSRFALKNILTNPVYMVADGDAYRYFDRGGADIFAGKGDFDGKNGVMAYNRTIQKKGKANQTRPMSEWIVAVGKHEGLISGVEWARAQECLGRNRSKAFRRPRGVVALLPGLLLCGGCGGHMRPKLSKRHDARGEPVFSYLCEMKEKSRSQICAMKNAGGNALDRAVMEKIGGLGEDAAEFARLLEFGKKFEKKRLEGGGEYDDKLSEEELDALRKRMAFFGEVLNDADIAEKRAILRAFVDNAVWDGENVRINLSPQPLR
ncbi:MAG: recombinase family protein, partial [Defluviitaleaceae bacterium]|nr:recombinase family protein [Defluviitaleaceae bacterium]